MKKEMDKIIGAILSAAACVLVLSILVGGFWTTKYTGTGNNPSDQISPAVAQNNIYHPEEATVAYDSEAHVRYYNNLLFVILMRELSDEEADTLAAQVGGQVVGSRNGSLNFLQIMVEESSLDQLQADADKLMESEDVLYAVYDSPMKLEANESDWSGSDLGNEANPSGDDWWAEAVGAYTAWEYSNRAEPIKVCVIDSYFDTDHPELSGKVTMLNENYATEEDKKNSNHGTHVAGLIAAKHNGEGIRGIADGAELLLIDWSQKDDDWLCSGEYLNILSTAIEQGAKVVNMSFGYEYLDEKEFKKSNKNRSYDEYTLEHLADCERSALLCMAWMLTEYVNGYSDYLLVQSAGNGKKRDTEGIDAYIDNYIEGDQEGIDAYLKGYFPSITEQTYTQLKELMDGMEKRYLDNIPFSFFRDRIITVGAVKNSWVDDLKGTYEVARFSNYGDQVDICAPGENIYSSTLDGKYENLNGTSMAAPIVSGAAALVWSLNPPLTAPEVKEILLSNLSSSAYRIHDYPNYTMLNVADAVKKARYYAKEDPDEKLLDYLNDELIPKYGLFSENFKWYNDASGTTELTVDSGQAKIDGILFAYIYDYDKDGKSELLVQRYEEQKNGNTKILLEMYEANYNKVRLADSVSYSTSRFDSVEYDVRTALFMSRQEKTDHPVINLYVSLSDPAGELDDDYAAFKDSTFNSDSVMKNAPVNPNYNYESMRFFIYSGGMFVQDGEYFETQEGQSFFWTSDLQLQTSDELAVITKEAGGDTRVDGAALVEQDSEAAYKSREQHSLIGYLARFDDYGAGRGLNYNRFYIELDDYTSVDKYYVKDLFKENNEIVWFSEMDVRLEKQDGPGKAVYINDYSKLNMINTWTILFESEKTVPETEQPSTTPAITEVPKESSSQALLSGSLNIEIQTLTPTAQISIQYPVVTGADTASVLALNQRFLTEAQELADAEVNELSSMGDGVSFTRTIENAYISSPVISFTIRDYAYYGGAHGIPGAKGFSYDLLQDKELSMGELLGCTDEVAREAAVLAFSRTDLVTSGTISAETFREGMDEATFWLGEDGVHVMFQINTMGAYSLGLPEAVVLQSDVEAARS